MSEYTYDEEGFNFFYFLLSVLSLCLVPITGHSIYSLWKSTLESTTEKNICQCQTCIEERIKSQKSQPSKIKQMLTSPKFLFIVFGWIAVGLLAYQVSFAEPAKAKWDPYQILDISEGATLPEIKKVYRKLSLVYHPDKAPEDKQKEYEETFIQISKAYQVLTDEDIRKNYEQYGHPDGKQSFSMGVALPRTLVEGGNSKFVLLFYAIAFGLGLPFYIARWWNNSRRQTKDNILNSTMGVFVKGLKENDGFKELIKVLSGAYEFQENVQVHAGEEQLVKQVDAVIHDELENRFGEKYERSENSVPMYRRKARTLLYAYFLRIDLASKSAGAGILAEDQKYIVKRSVHILQGLLQIATVKQWLNVAILIMDLQQDLLQGLYPGDASVKQLPHINNQLLRRYARSNKAQINSVQQLVNLSESERKSLLSPLSESEYLDVMEVAQRVPRLSVQKAIFKVIGDKIITTGAIITFVLKLKNGQVDSVETTIGKDKEDESEDEDEFDEQGNTRVKKDDDNGNNGQGLPMAHTPYYPNEKKPYWWIFLGDPKVNRILVPPRKVTDIVDEKTIRVPFAGPPKPGTYTFSLFVKSDTYAGTDILQDIQLTIQDPTDLPPEDEVDDSISEPEEDSIAGQMKMMREQGLASALAGGSNADDGKGAQGQKGGDDSDSDSDSDSSSDEE